MKETIVKTIAATAGTVMKGLDALFTSDDERNKARIVVEQTFNQLSATVLSAMAAMEAERTERHKNDMQSDSWLSKNIRPLTLIYLTALFTFLVIADSVTAPTTIAGVSTDSFSVAPVYVDLLKILMVSAYGFYFVSRGVEKVSQAVKSMRNTIKVE